MTKPSPWQRFTFRLGWWLRGALALFPMTACANRDIVGRFMDTDYREHVADPGRVNLQCYDSGSHDNGYPKAWNDTYCGCVDFTNKEVWIARNNDCNTELTRKHERCHVKTGPSKKARELCDRKF